MLNALKNHLPLLFSYVLLRTTKNGHVVYSCNFQRREKSSKMLKDPKKRRQAFEAQKEPSTSAQLLSLSFSLGAIATRFGLNIQKYIHIGYC